MQTVPTPEEAQRILCRIAAGLGLPAEQVTVPYQADRFATAGEQCFCGQPAIVIYAGTRYGDLGFCGGRHG